ncbi:HypC/HybG/HupF family hydrogenase formation chaperone [bacterium]|nr:HypC/HybG/HupF family hydrogenase formation chaperone [bacterium]
MCLAIPMKLIKIEGERGTVEAGGVQRQIGLQMTPDADIGDFLIIHAGFSIQRMEEKEALETLALFEEMERLA